jgi:hypothetical protein
MNYSTNSLIFNESVNLLLNFGLFEGIVPDTFLNKFVLVKDHAFTKEIECVVSVVHCESYVGQDLASESSRKCRSGLMIVPMVHVALLNFIEAILPINQRVIVVSLFSSAIGCELNSAGMSIQ